MGRLDDFLKELKEREGGDGKIRTAGLDPSFENCGTVYRSVLGNPKDDELPLTIGKIKGKDTYLLAFGDDAPFKLEKNHLFYLITALTKISSSIIKKEEGEDLQKAIEKSLKAGDCVPNIGKGAAPNSKSLEDIQELVNAATEAKKKLKEDVDEDDMDAYEEAKQKVKDYQEVFNSFTGEEKAKLEKEIAKKKENLLYDKAKKLEEALSGELETTESITYDYSYFKNVYKQKGVEHMREELAKIPKDERKDIINKIVEEVQKEAKDDDD